MCVLPCVYIIIDQLYKEKSVPAFAGEIGCFRLFFQPRVYALKNSKGETAPVTKTKAEKHLASGGTER